jgi:hypothetical protein
MKKIAWSSFWSVLVVVYFYTLIWLASGGEFNPLRSVLPLPIAKEQAMYPHPYRYYPRSAPIVAERDALHPEPVYDGQLNLIGYTYKPPVH